MNNIIKISTLAIVLIAILLPMELLGQSLKGNASMIRSDYPDEYQKTIRQHAINEWGNEHDMVVYEINKQADALIELINSFESNNTNIAASAIEKWSISGHKRANMRKFKNMNTFNLDNLIKLHCEWDMVKYEYDKQVEAKNSY